MFQEIGLASLGAAEDEISKLGRPKNGGSSAGCMKTVPLEYTYKGGLLFCDSPFHNFLPFSGVYVRW